MKRVVIEKLSRIFDDFFAIDEAWLSFERTDGTMSPVVRRLSFERGDSVAALLFDREEQAIVLVRQFRFPTHGKGPGWILEAVAGIVDEGESPEEAIRREVLEETGYRVDQLEHISTFYVSPGGSSERIGLYYAEVGRQDHVGEGHGVLRQTGCRCPCSARPTRSTSASKSPAVKLSKTSSATVMRRRTGAMLDAIATSSETLIG